MYFILINLFLRLGNFMFGPKCMVYVRSFFNCNVICNINREWKVSTLLMYDSGICLNDRFYVVKINWENIDGTLAIKHGQNVTNWIENDWSQFSSVCVQKSKIVSNRSVRKWVMKQTIYERCYWNAGWDPIAASNRPKTRHDCLNCDGRHNVIILRYCRKNRLIENTRISARSLLFWSMLILF